MLPPLDLEEIKNRMIEVGLIAHGLRATTILEDELLIIAETMMNRAAVRKFILEDVPAIPLSLGARSLRLLFRPSFFERPSFDRTSSRAVVLLRLPFENPDDRCFYVSKL
ncbi:hypothetical protein Salat_0176700 [Sesamum alatum]|uniref:Uncharacterized protein n=1 Tax=Sesamum alatum TaxID=300844 RepID=A0AAE2CY70_9LAMI|nr:hypothetical protein Salat_0176700 [Sesamum alatum]